MSVGVSSLRSSVWQNESAIQAVVGSGGALRPLQAAFHASAASGVQADGDVHERPASSWMIVNASWPRLLPALVPTSIRFTRYAGSPGIGTPSGSSSFGTTAVCIIRTTAPGALFPSNSATWGRERRPVGHGPSAPRFLVGPRPDDVATGSVGPGASHAVSSSNSTHPSKQAPSWPFGRLQRSRAALFSFPHRGRGRRPLVSILMACLTLVGCVRAQGAGARFGLQRAVCGRSSRSRQIEKMSSSLSSSPGSSGDRSVSPRPKVSVGVRAPAR